MTEKKTDNSGSSIKNRAPYCKTVLRNSLKNEYHSNDNAAKHISPTGVWFDGYTLSMEDATAIENRISIQSPQDWLLFIGDERLHAALRQLKPKDLEFLFVMFKNGYTQRQMAAYLGIRQQVVQRRWKRISEKILKFF